MRSAVGAAFSYQCAATLTDLHLGNVTAMAFSPTGEYLASASDDKTLFIIDVFRRWPRLLLEMEHPAFVTAVIWSDASLLYLGRSDGIIFVLLVKVDENRIQVVEEIPAPTSPAPIQYLAYHEGDGETLLAASYGNCVRIYRRALEACGNVVWNPLRGFVAGEPQTGFVTSLQFIDHPVWLLLTAHADAGITLWDRNTTTFRFHHSSIGGAYLLPDGSRLFLRNLDGEIEVLRLRSSRPWFEVEAKDPLPVTFDPAKNYLFPIQPLDDQVLLTGSAAGKAILFSSSTMAQHLIEHDDEEVYKTATCDTIFATASRGDDGSVVRVFARDLTRWVAARSSSRAPLAKSFNMRDLHVGFVKDRQWRRVSHDFALSLIMNFFGMVAVFLALAVCFGDKIEPEGPHALSAWRWIPAAIRFHILSLFHRVANMAWVALFAGPWAMVGEVVQDVGHSACLSVVAGNTTTCDL